MSTLIRPSHKTGFARNASESAYPQLWTDLEAAFCPLLGKTGRTLRDYSGHKRHATIANDFDWVETIKGPAVYHDTTYSLYSTSGASLPDINVDVGFSGALYYSPVSFDWNQRTVQLQGDTIPDLTTWGNDENGYWEPNNGQMDPTNTWQLVLGNWYVGSFGMWHITANPCPIANRISGPNLNERYGGAQWNYTEPTGNLKLTFGRNSDDYLGAFYYWNRVVDHHELDIIHRDPFAPFRLRRRLHDTVLTTSSTYSPSGNAHGGMMQLTGGMQ